VSATSSKAYTGSRAGGGYGFSRDSRETTLANGRRRIQEVASRLRLGGHYVDSAHRLFTIAVEKNFVQGRRTIHVVAACLYISCRQEKSQHMLIDFSDALQVNVYTLGTCFLKFRRLLGLKLEIIDPALYVYRFAAHLSLDDKANQVAMTALRLVGRMRRDWIVAGRRPAGICAAALLIAARAHGFHRQPQDVTRILRVCGMTVTTRVKEFEQTPSSKLTLEQFNRGVEFQQEADPPVFTRNRIREARARAIDGNDVELLNSGGLDDPMSGKRGLTKWRDGKVSKKAEEFEKLYKCLESEVEKEKLKQAAGAKSTDGDGSSESEEEKTEKEQVSDGQEKEQNDDADDSEKLSSQEQQQQQDTVDENEKHTGEDDSEENDTTKESQDNLEITNSKWDRAYPKNNFGKRIILPDHATPEERRPPTQPVEGRLDTKAWQKDMPKEMIEDIDLIFLTPEEVAQKEAIFNKANKTYLEKEALKEKQRTSEEQAQNMEDEEMVEQAKGMERYARKRKGREKDLSATTEEALLEAVANRKISRKINYDAMSAIFDDDGQFSTGGTAPDPFDDDAAFNYNATEFEEV
jgi:Transcription factor TFIIB repeat/Brf1-like TBP-binding domain